MPIQTDDIKLLASAVMADTPDGGGAMTGNVIADGVSNNLFPDTSSVDRALGRVSIRQIFGVAQTNDTDTLLGTHAMIVDAPDDPLVHCALMPAPRWGAVRTEYKERIERYVVKGSKAGPALFDTQYTGSLQIRLISFLDVPFPVGGDALVLATPTGQEQYVRLLKTVLSTQQVAVFEGASVTVLTATVATCELSQALAVDFVGPPPSRITPSGYAEVFLTNTSSGAKFFGIKKLGTAASIGDLSATVSDGIFTPIVPASTIETAIVDQAGMRPITQLNFTSIAPVALDAALVTLAPNRTLYFPGAIVPGSISFSAGVLQYTDDALGKLMLSGSVVGQVDYKLGVASFGGTAPNNGVQTVVANYSPATLSLATNNSTSLTITANNQGLAFTNSISPMPSPGSVSLSYMAQGRWYELRDNLQGKLEASEPSFGVGTVSYTTGSVAFTLGAQPDIDSDIIINWGSQETAKPLPPAALPAKFSAEIPLASGAVLDQLALAWNSGATGYAATLGADGLLAGDATGTLVNGTLIFEPGVFPTGDVTVSYKSKTAVASPTFTGSAGLYQITSALPIAAGTLKFNVAVAKPLLAIESLSSVAVFDFAGQLYVANVNPSNAARQAVGTVNYATGEVALNPSVTLAFTEQRTTAIPGSPYWNTAQFMAHYFFSAAVSLSGAISGLAYSTGTASALSQQVYTPTAWICRVKSAESLSADIGTKSLSFSVGNQKYTVKDGNIVQNWSFGTNGGGVLVAGVVSGSGVLSLNPQNLPANGVNAVSFSNITVNNDPGRQNAGVFRILGAPVKVGVFQITHEALTGTANAAGVISGGGFSGSVDFTRGIVRWAHTDFLDPTKINYNAVLLQYLPLDATLLGLSTERLPLDGKVPIFRKSELAVVHNTLSTQLPNPLTKGTAYALGRARIASVRAKTVAGATVPQALYTVNYNTGELTVPVGSDISALPQPWTIENRIEDLMVVSEVDISGRLKFTRSLTHNFPANTSFVSSALPFGDVFGRVADVFDQQAWTDDWADARIGLDTLAGYNTIDHPITTTNRGAVTERWALIFTSNTAFRIVGERYGQVGTGDINTQCAPMNTAAAAPFFSIAPVGWGGGWAAGNVLRLNTFACGAAFGVVRTVLQGPDTLASDEFTLAFRADVNA